MGRKTLVMAEYTTDLLIIGSGATGLTAAVVAAHHGSSVLVVEKEPVIGGTSALSGAAAWIPNNPHMAPNGLDDSPEQARQYIKSIMGNYFDAAKTDAFLKSGPEMIDFMETNSAVKFDNWHSLDYEPWRDGAARGRTVGGAIFDGRRLSAEDLAAIAPNLPALTIFNGMQIAFADVPQFANVLRSFQNFRYTAGKVARYFRDRLVHGRTTRLPGGTGLVAALLLSAREKGVAIWPASPMQRLITDDHGVCGAIIHKDNEEVEVFARRGVILASGGYGANEAMRRTYLPLADAGWSLQPKGNVGDGIKSGEKAGGHLITDNASNAIWAAISSMHENGRRHDYVHNLRDRAFPGFLMVDQTGHRFVNEGVSYQALGNVMNEKELGSVWLICDHASLRRYGMGHAKPSPLPYQRYVRNGYLNVGRTVEALAKRIGLEPDVLARTVERFNRYAEVGEDPDFHKGEDDYTAAQGDLEHQPNPALGPLRAGPYYAVELVRGEFCTVNGLQTDPSARVVSRDGSPIPGLYAIGIDANSIFRGTYPGGGSSIGPGMTFAYIAATDAVAADTPKESRS